MWQLSRLTVIADTGGRSRARQITSLIGVQRVGMLAGPLIGGFAAVAWDLRVAFVMHAVVALAVVRLRNLVAAVMLASIFSLLSAGVFVMLQAVDVAFTEAAVRAGVTTVSIATLFCVSRVILPCGSEFFICVSDA